MYRIDLLRFGSGNDVAIYNQSQMTEPSPYAPALALELNEAGSLTFTLPVTNPIVSELQPIETYLKAYKDGNEIFYGRILQRSDPTLLGQVSFECEGELSFLLDSEVTPYGVDEDGKQITKTLTAETFFRWCIDQHNACIDDPRRRFTVGTVSATWKDEEQTYSVSTYTQTKSIIEGKILDVYGGFLRTYPNPNGSGRMIDWVQNYDHVNSQTIAIGVNVEDQTNSVDGNDIFTAFRPVGDNNLVLSDNEIIPIFSNDQMTRYGVIVKSVSFSGVTDQETLQSKANAYKERIQASLFKSSNIRMVDMHYLDGTSPWLWIGDRFTNIKGLEGEEMIVSSLNLDFENVQNDTISLKNRRSLDPDASSADEENQNDRKSDSYAKKMGKTAAKAAQYFKTIKETGKDLEISADNVWMHGKTLTQNYDEIRQTANWFENIASRANQADQILDQQTQRINNHDVIVRPIEGTAIVKDPYFIADVAGLFEIWEDQTTGKKTVHLISGSELIVDDENGVIQNVGERLAISYNKSTSLDEFFTAETYEGGTSWTMKDKIAGIVGMYRIETTQIEDPNHPGQYIEQRNLVFIEGGGYKVERNGVEYGLYDEGTLTAGLMVDKINDETQTQLRADKIKIWGTSSLDNLVGHWEEYTVVNGVDENNQPIYTKGLRYVAEAGMRVRRTDDNTGITSEFGVYDSGNLTGGIMVEKINGQTETYIKGSKVHVGDEPEDWTLPDWAADRDGLIAAKATIGDLAAVSARVGTLEADYVKASSLYTTIGGIKYITGKAITVTGAVTGQNIYADNGDVYLRKFSSQGVPTGSAQMSNAVSGAHVTLSGNTYTLHLYDMFGNELTPETGRVMTFSRATDLSGAWGSGENSGQLTVTASPQGNTYVIDFPNTERSDLLSSAAANTMTITTPNDVSNKIYVMNENGKNAVDLRTVGYKNGSVQGVTVARITHGQYDAGWNAAYNKVNVDGYFPSSTPTTIPQSIYTAKVHPSVDGDRTNYQYYVTADETYAYIRYGGTSGAIVARVKHNQWATGYDACAASITTDTTPSGTLSYGQTYTINVQYTNRSSGVPTTKKTITFKAPADRYNTGYDACASTIRTDTTPSGTLSYGQTYTINVQYTDRSSGVPTTKKTITFKAPEDRWSIGYNAAVNTISLEKDFDELDYSTTYHVYAKYIDQSSGTPKTSTSFSFRTPDDRWGDGYDDCAFTIKTDTTPSGTLSYGQSYTINVQYTNRSSGLPTTKKTITFTVPADRWATGYDTAVATISFAKDFNASLDYSTTYHVYGQYTDRSTGTKKTAQTLTFTSPADRYNTGYNADHSLYICKGESKNKVTELSLNPGQSEYVTPIFKKLGTGYQNGAQCLVKAKDYQNAKEFYYWYQESFYDSSGGKRYVQVWYTLYSSHPSADRGHLMHFDNTQVACSVDWD